MRKNVFPMPSEPTLIAFIEQSCAIENLSCSIVDVTTTLQKARYDPLAAGHLSAIKYAIKLASTTGFPARFTFEAKDVEESDKNLYWIRTMHEKLMRPIAEHGKMVPKLDSCPISPGDCGNYTIQQRALLDPRSGIPRRFPKPTLIKPLLHWWFHDLVSIHLKMAPKVDRAVLSMSKIKELSEQAYQKHIQFVCIHPFADGTGRLGRLIENTLRLRWGLAWTTINRTNKLQYTQDIIRYEDSTTWKEILKSQQ